MLLAKLQPALTRGRAPGKNGGLIVALWSKRERALSGGAATLHREMEEYHPPTLCSACPVD